MHAPHCAVRACAGGTTVSCSPCAVVLGSGIARGAPEAPPITPDVQDAIGAYLRDPVANAKEFLATPRAPDDQLNPVQALLLGDAAVRVGQYRTASELFAAVRD